MLVRDKRVKIDQKDKQCRTPLILAAEWGKVDALQFLLTYGSGKTLKDSNGKDALTIALYREKPEAAIPLIRDWPDNRTEVERQLMTHLSDARKAHAANNKINMALMDARRFDNKQAFLERRQMPINFLQSKEPLPAFMVAARRAREDAARQREEEDARARLAQRARLGTPPSRMGSPSRGTRELDISNSRGSSRASSRPGSSQSTGGGHAREGQAKP